MPFPLALRVSIEKSADSLMGVPLHVIGHFSLVAFSILSLPLFLSVWLLYILVCSSLSLSCLGLCASWTWLTISSPILGKSSAITSSNIFSGPFSLSSSSVTPIMRMLVHLMFYLRGFLGCLHPFYSNFCILSWAVISTILFSRSLVHSSASVILPLIISSVLFISVCLFFSSSRSLVNISWIFSKFVSKFFPEILNLHYHYSEFFFLECCLSPPHLVVFLGFYLVPSSGT